LNDMAKFQSISGWHFTSFTLYLREYTLLLHVNARLINCVPDAELMSIGFLEDERKFISEQRGVKLFTLASLIVRALWDTMESSVADGLADTLIFRPEMCNNIRDLPKVRNALDKCAKESITTPQMIVDSRNALADAIGRLFARTDNNGVGREGIERFEYWINVFGLAPMSETELQRIESIRESIVHIQRLRNSLTHLMGRVKHHHRPPNLSAPEKEAFFIHVYQTTGKIVDQYIVDVALYLGTLSNRIARTLGEPEPAPF
jgi:hypothetical protein